MGFLPFPHHVTLSTTSHHSTPSTGNSPDSIWGNTAVGIAPLQLYRVSPGVPTPAVPCSTLLVHPQGSAHHWHHALPWGSGHLKDGMYSHGCTACPGPHSAGHHGQPCSIPLGHRLEIHSSPLLPDFPCSALPRAVSHPSHLTLGPIRYHLLPANPLLPKLL